jgi:hypothetical protein
MSLKELIEQRNKIAFQLAEINCKLEQVLANDLKIKNAEEMVNRCLIKVTRAECDVSWARATVNWAEEELTAKENDLEETKKDLQLAEEELRALNRRDEPDELETLPASPKSEPEFYNFNLNGVDYLRLGTIEDDGEMHWDESNDLWFKKNQFGDLWFKEREWRMGAYAGRLLPSLLIDSSPEVLANEPLII